MVTILKSIGPGETWVGVVDCLLEEKRGFFSCRRFV